MASDDPVGAAEPQSVRITVRVNGEPRTAHVEPRLLLSDFLRGELQLTGTHVGCEHGVCGACTVNIDGAIARSCTTFAVQVDGSDLRTVEALSDGPNLHPIQEAFRDNHGLQCGFCTPGFLMATEELLAKHPDPTEKQIREFLAGNVCRCTGYMGIVAAVRDAASRIGSGTEA